jgi:uncharacterized membrane protein YphA (DoxX/SURF4 family)
LILRAAAGFAALGATHWVTDLSDTTVWPLRCLTLGIALLLWVGLWTPVAAVAEAALQIGLAAFSQPFNAVTAIYAALGMGLAMLGPGSWSLDARLFGRKRIV